MMIFTEDLEELIFNRHKIVQNVDQLIVLSGYVGPVPVRRLEELPFSSKVIYGMYGSEGITPSFHDALLEVQENVKHVDIFYSQIPIHAKCYTWHTKNKILHALIGSANFSAKGLQTKQREILAETASDSFSALNSYIETVLNNSISCLEAGIIPEPKTHLGLPCLLSLLGRNNEVQNCAGLNWGQNSLQNHTHPSDAYITIRKQDIRDFPALFPPKQRAGKRRQNDPIEIIWDDGVHMEGLLMGTQDVDGVSYPKQVSSHRTGKAMGIYLRRRLGVPEEQPVRKHHLVRYGKTDIRITLVSDGVYYFDFSR